jgi:hypothetical protein
MGLEQEVSEDEPPPEERTHPPTYFDEIDYKEKKYNNALE